jgi:hypothetical protein
VERFPVEGGEVVVLPTVQGLVAERDAVRRAFTLEAPAAIALGVSPEAAASLLRFERAPDMDDPFEDLPDHDYVYSVVLREFGEVDLPPPDLLEAARIGKAAGLPVYGVDLPDEAYEEAFTREVSVWGFLRYGRIQRRLARKPPRAPDARAFSLAWDAAIRRVKGIARLERMREERIAAGARALAAQVGGRVLLVVDHPRAEGVQRALAAPAGR